MTRRSRRAATPIVQGVSGMDGQCSLACTPQRQSQRPCVHPSVQASACIVALCGLPASGKSTAARALAAVAGASPGAYGCPHPG